MKEEKRIKTKEEWMDELGIDDEGDIVGEEDLEVPVDELFADKETRIWISGEEAQKYKIWDFLTFSHEWKTLKKEIKNSIKYSSLEDYIENISATNLSWIEIIKMHNSIIWNEESIKKYWINGFKCKSEH